MSAIHRALLPVLCCALVAGLCLAPSASADTQPISAADATGASIERGTVLQVQTTLANPDPGTGRRAVYSITQQHVWVLDATDHLVREFPISGRLDQPSTGTFHVFSKSMYTCSSSHPDTCMRYMIRFTKGPQGDNIGFHEIPMRHGTPVQTYAQLGQPISDGCLRETTADAQFMWKWASIGTTVVVIP